MQGCVGRMGCPGVHTSLRHGPATAFLPPQRSQIPGRPAQMPALCRRITMTLAGLSLLLIASALFAVLSRVDPTD